MSYEDKRYYAKLIAQIEGELPTLTDAVFRAGVEAALDQIGRKLGAKDFGNPLTSKSLHESEQAALRQNPTRCSQEHVVRVGIG